MSVIPEVERVLDKYNYEKNSGSCHNEQLDHLYTLLEEFKQEHDAKLKYINSLERVIISHAIKNTG